MGTPSVSDRSGKPEVRGNVCGRTCSVYRDPDGISVGLCNRGHALIFIHTATFKYCLFFQPLYFSN